jgi:hypothetical protein
VAFGGNALTFTPGLKHFRFVSDLEYYTVGFDAREANFDLAGWGNAQGCQTPLASALLAGNTSLSPGRPGPGAEARKDLRLRAFG